MGITFALDVYGTLIDPLAITRELRQHAGDAAPGLSELWRNKQLEYSFRRALMENYKPFPDVTRAALDYACLTSGVELPEEAKVALMAKYRALPAFDDVGPALSVLESKGARLHAFSNGLADDVSALLEATEIGSFFESIVTVEELRTFKPDPRVYAHFNKITGSWAEETWLVSSNPFDVIGASAVGWNTAWVKRRPTAVFDPWEYSPTRTIASLKELVSLCPETDSN